VNAVQQVIDLQSFQVQALIGFAIPWLINKAIASNLPFLRSVQASWARWLSLISSALVALGIHLSWMGGWDMQAGGTISFSLMLPGLSDLVNAASQFMLNEINYRVFHKERPAAQSNNPA